MIDFGATQDLFRNMARSGWRSDDLLLWGYFFIDPDREKLTCAATELERLGHQTVDIYEPELEEGEPPYFFLHVEKIEKHSPESLHAKNQALEALAVRFALRAYDGMDVGKPDSRIHPKTITATRQMK